jgi:hypothetical protein
VDAVHPKPLHILVVRDTGLSVADIDALGVRRIRAGGALTLAGSRQATVARSGLDKGSFHIS